MELVIGTPGKPKQSSMTTMEGKLQQVKSLLSSSSVNDLRVIDFELTSKIRSSVVLTSKDLYEQFLAKKLHRNFLSESFFPSKIAESVSRNGLLWGIVWTEKWITKYQWSNRMNHYQVGDLITHHHCP